MGGCCCCSSRRAQLNEHPVYFYCPRDQEEHGSHGHNSALSRGLMLGTDPDTYQAPPPPLPYDVALGQSQALCGIVEDSDRKDGPVEAIDSHSVEEAMSNNSLTISVTYEDLKLDHKNQKDDIKGSPKVSENELLKSSEFIVPEEDICPTCFEEYDVENPKIVTKCEHHFHLSCILEWMERSDTCPICDKEMIFDHKFSK